MKKWRKTGRKFLNPSKECTAAVMYVVEVSPHWNKKKDEFRMNGDLTMTRDATNHYVQRKADLRPLYNMQKELAVFIELCEIALKEVEEYNAKSKTTT